jgi:putative MATE family efflux protein
LSAGTTHAARRRAKSSVGGHIRIIAGFGIPLIAFFLIQGAVDLASTAMLGRLGDRALAGVGAANAIYGVLLALLFGFDTGVQAIAARAIGAQLEHRLGEVLLDALVASIPVGAVLTATAWFAAPSVLPLILSDRAATAMGAAWLRASAPSLLCLALTIPVNALWIGSGRPHITGLVTALLAPIQIALTLILIFGAGGIAAEGAPGAGLAMTATTFAGVAVQFALAIWVRPIPGFLRAAPRLANVAAVLAIGWPVSLQQSLLRIGLMIAFAIVAQLGTAQAAIINVLVTLNTVPLQSAVGLGTAAAILVGQSLGRGDVREARRWGWRASWVALCVALPPALIAILVPRHLLALFLRDPATLALALTPARLAGVGVVLGALANVITFAMRGAGATKTASIVPFCSQALILLPLMWFVGIKLGRGIVGVVEVQVALAALEVIAMMFIWSRSWWARVRLGEIAPNPEPATP